MEQTSSDVFTPFSFSCGVKLKNRLVKAAMEENMANANMQPGHALFSLYRYWAHGDLGAIITGNVMVDYRAPAGAGNVVLDERSDLANFKKWAGIIRSGGSKAFMQLNHPGRQMLKAMGETAMAPSAVKLKLGRHSKLFAKPVGMSCQQIYAVIQQFVTSAALAKQAGFDGVQIHAAHGFLLSQFLSPLTNQRDDQWGGTLQNRCRILLNIVSQIRANCGSDFAILVKLNSGDFVEGGFTPEESLQVIKLLENIHVDMVEISGGNLEAPAMQGERLESKELNREAYFLSIVEKMKQSTAMPIMTTGGIARLAVAQKVVQQGCDLVGIASALAFTPDLVKKWQCKPDYQGVQPKCNWKDRSLASWAKMAMVRRQLRRLGNDLTTMRQPTSWWSLLLDILHRRKMLRYYRANLSKLERDDNTKHGAVTHCASSRVLSDAASRDL